MKENLQDAADANRYLVPTAIGAVIGGALSLLGTPFVVVILLAGMATAYAFGWRIVVRRVDTERRNGRTLDL